MEIKSCLVVNNLTLALPLRATEHWPKVEYLEDQVPTDAPFTMTELAATKTIHHENNHT